MAKTSELIERKNITASSRAWQKFRSNPVSLASVAVIVLIVLIAVAGYLICPDKSPNANTQHLELAARKPGFSVPILEIRKNKVIPERGFFKTMSGGREAANDEIPILDYHFRADSMYVRNYTDLPKKEESWQVYYIPDVVYPLDETSAKTFTGGSFTFRDIRGNVIHVSLDELVKDIEEHHLKTRTFLMGTDRFGRDMLSRMILGARVSLSVGFIAVLISLFIGISLGAMAGYNRGRTDDIIMWLISVVWSVPTLLLVIALTMVIGKGFWQIFIAVGLTMWVEVARVVRGQVMSLREKEYIMAARALGYGDLRIMFRHILPNILAPVIIIAASNFASAILIEAGLSFLGIGVQPPVPSWGTMVRDHYGFIIVDKTYLAFIPGFAIMILVLAFTLSGNGLRDALDVRSGS